MADAVIVVAAAIIRRGDAFLLGRRLEGTHLAGLWEFPGGKCEPGETLAACLSRELQEELGVRALEMRPRVQTRHRYDTRTVELHFFDCTIDGEPRPLLGQELRWVRRDELRSIELPEADAELVAMLTPEVPPG
ncbi:MAG TPA: (deoxy)nucleoside triphosphate pyrophosphohydrolase [Vicinamibacterales bacterium]